MLAETRNQSRWPDARPAIPQGERVYAIGDIHGQAKLLDELLWKIGEDFAAAPETSRRLIFLGDYVDRGPRSSDVLDRLIQLTGTDIDCVFLKGNHEERFLRFVGDSDLSNGQGWLKYGGAEALKSYGITVPFSVLDSIEPNDRELEAILTECAEAVPKAHLDFLRCLPVSFRVGDYFFAHAGIRPGVPLNQQSERDLMWIRHEFLDSEECHPLFIVHGHTPVMQPEIRANRMDIDTGAGWDRQLTAVVLWGTERRFISVGPPPPPDGF